MYSNHAFVLCFSVLRLFNKTYLFNKEIVLYLNTYSQRWNGIKELIYHVKVPYQLLSLEI